MRLDDLPTSDRVEDRRGIPGGRAGLLAGPKATGLITRKGLPALGTARQRPENIAVRFSTKCATPSLKSSEPNDAIISLSATAQASAKDWKYDWKTCRLMTPIERGDDAVTNSRAIACTWARKSSAGSWRTRPS